VSTYRRLPADTQLRRSFSITVGLVEGYQDCAAHDKSAAIAVHSAWMLDQIAAGQPYLTGVFTAANLSYAWPRPEHGGGGQARVEPAVVFSGEVSVLYQAGLADEKVMRLLDELAARLGSVLGQTRVYVAYRATTWVLEAEAVQR
jgi:hypothetical protein